MSRDELLGLVRHLATIVGTLLAGRGILNNGELELWVGLAVTVTAIAWSIWAKRQAAAETAAKVEAALYTTPPRDPELDQ